MKSLDKLKNKTVMWFLKPIIEILTEVLIKMSDLSDAVDAIQTAVDALAANLNTATTDIEKTINDLIAKIAAGQDTTGAVASLKASLDKLTAANSAIQALDAEAVSKDV